MSALEFSFSRGFGRSVGSCFHENRLKIDSHRHRRTGTRSRKLDCFLFWISNQMRSGEEDVNDWRNNVCRSCGGLCDYISCISLTSGQCTAAHSLSLSLALLGITVTAITTKRHCDAKRRDIRQTIRHKFRLNNCKGIKETICINRIKFTRIDAVRWRFWESVHSP